MLLRSVGKIRGIFCILLLLVFVRLSVCSASAYELDSKGFIRDWLIIGPYPSYASEGAPKGFSEDLLAALGGEAEVEPYPGMRDRSAFVADKGKLIAGLGSTNEWGFKDTRHFDVEWRELHWREEKPIIDLNGSFGDIRDHLVAYAACRILSPGPQTVQLRLGSDDGYKLYVNQAYIGGLAICRAAQPNSNIHLVELRKGTNLIVLKIVDRTGGHGFCMAITDQKGKPAKDLTVVLDDPVRRFAAECGNLERVDAIDGSAFAQMGLENEAPYFPGKHRVLIGLGYARSVDVSLELLLTDAKDQPLFRQTRTASLQASKAFLVSADIECKTSGPLRIAAVVKEKASGKLLAHLTKEIQILAPAAVQTRLEDLTKDEKKLKEALHKMDRALREKDDGLKQLRAGIAEQYARIEQLYLKRHIALAKEHGEKGRSIREPFQRAETDRATLCLNGDSWEIAPATKLEGLTYDTTQPPKTGWDRSRVPIDCFSVYFRSRNVPVRGKGNPYYGPSETMPCGDNYVLSPARTAYGVWYRLRFDLPEGWTDRSLTLALHNTVVHVRAFLNGKLLGDEKVWCAPLRFPLVGAKARDNLLMVYVASDRTIGPVRKQLTKQMWGIGGDVVIEATPKLSVSDTWVITSWREASIEARTWVTNQTGKEQTVELRQFCLRDGRIRLRLGTRKVKVRHGSMAEIRVSRPWTDPDVWGIGGKYGEPALYELVTDLLLDGKLVDRHFTRFGFREFWVEGHHFYLNGKRIFLQGDNGHFRQNMRRQLEVILPLLRTDHINMIRSHQHHPFSYNTNVLPKLADELGMLVCAQMYPILHPYQLPKSGNSKKVADGYLSEEEFLAHPIHFQNLANYARWVRMMRNHPSVVVYSTDNEIFTQSWDYPDRLDANIRNDRLGAYYGQYVKRLDPTRVLTRDGDEGTWGHKGKWQEDPPCDTANYHYPDFHIKDFALNWETVYDGRPVIFGETLYHSYGAWDGWIGAIPSQVAAKAKRVREVASLYRDLEIPGAIYMALSLDGFIQLDKDGCGPWRLTPEMLDEYRENGIVQALPRYPYFPIEWPSLSGPGFKKEFAVMVADTHGERGVNWFDSAAPSHFRNAVNDAYRDSLTPMPPLKASRVPELLVRMVKNGSPVPGIHVFVRPAENQPAPPMGIMTDTRGTAWFVLPAPGAYTIRVGQSERTVQVDLIPNDPPTPGFEYLKTIEMTVESGEE